MQNDTPPASRHLKNAPIQEAVLHIRSGLDRTDPTNGRAVPYRPSVEEIEKRGFKFERYISLQEQFPPFVAVPKENNPVVGYRFSTEDKKWVLQWFKDGGVSLSQLAPYDSWERFVDYARPFFELAIAENELSETRSIGLRYINRFPISSPDELFKKYFRSRGDDPGIEGCVRKEFVSMSKFQLPDANTSLTVSRNLLEQIQNGRHALFAILDIDVIATPRGVSSWTDVWSVANRLRDLKNRVFFSQFTSKGLEAFNE